MSQTRDLCNLPFKNYFWHHHKACQGVLPPMQPLPEDCSYVSIIAPRDKTDGMREIERATRKSGAGWQRAISNGRDSSALSPSSPRSQLKRSINSHYHLKAVLKNDKMGWARRASITSRPHGQTCHQALLLGADSFFHSVLLWPPITLSAEPWTYKKYHLEDLCSVFHAASLN